jgi:hypothetical protein
MRLTVIAVTAAIARARTNEEGGAGDAEREEEA